MKNNGNPTDSKLSMTRRDFIKTTSLASGGLILAPGMGGLLARDIQQSIPSALDSPLRVKVVNTGRVHEAAWEGSCRAGNLENLTQETERNRLKQSLQQIKSTIGSLQFPPGIEFLEPVTLFSWIEKGNPNIQIPHSQFDPLTRDDPKTDVYVVTMPFEGYKIAEAYKKPVIIVQRAGWAVDLPAAVREMGIPSFHVKTWDQLNDVLPLFKAHKAVKNTKLLNVTNFPNRLRFGVVSSPSNLEILKEQYQMNYQYVDYKEFFKRMDHIEQDQSYQKEARKLAEDLIKNAGNNSMSKEDVIHSVEFYQTARDMMKKYKCNAFTIECFELCSTLQPWKRRFVPCLTHSLMKDNGIPSVCEADMNAFLAMMMEMYLSRKAVYMGNPNIYPEDNTLTINHSVASLNMHGIDKKDDPYKIESFTKEGFGVNLRYDFTRDKGQEVTVARFDPTSTKILVTSGKIIGGTGMSRIGCANRVDIKIPDGQTFWEESQDFGHHLAMVYGNYVKDIRNLGKIMNYEVRAVT